MNDEIPSPFRKWNGNLFLDAWPITCLSLILKWMLASLSLMTPLSVWYRQSVERGEREGRKMSSTGKISLSKRKKYQIPAEWIEWHLCRRFFWWLFCWSLSFLLTLLLLASVHFPKSLFSIRLPICLISSLSLSSPLSATFSARALTFLRNGKLIFCFQNPLHTHMHSSCFVMGLARGVIWREEVWYTHTRGCCWFFEPGEKFGITGLMVPPWLAGCMRYQIRHTQASTAGRETHSTHTGGESLWLENAFFPLSSVLFIGGSEFSGCCCRCCIGSCCCYCLCPYPRFSTKDAPFRNLQARNKLLSSHSGLFFQMIASPLSRSNAPIWRRRSY